MCAEALACGTNVVSNLCGGIMPQETNNLNYWKSGMPSQLLLDRQMNFPLHLKNLSR